jgi:hypothetical protein
MPYNPKKNGAANYKSWMQLTQTQIDAIAAVEGADNTNDPNAEQFAQVVYVVNSSGGSSSGGAIVDGVNDTLFATVADLTNSNPLSTMIVDANGDQIVSFGGGNSGIADGVDDGIVATVADLTNSNPLSTMIVDANGDQIVSFGGGNSGIADGVDDGIVATVADLTNSNPLATMIVDTNGDQIVSFGSSAIAVAGTPTPVADGADVNPWYDTYGRPVLFGANLSLNALDVNLINDSRISRMTPVTNLNAVVANTTGSAVDVSSYNKFTIHIFASSVTDGATVSIEHSLDGTNWVEVGTEVVSVDGNVEYTFNEAYRYLRTSVSSYTDGTYTTLIYAGN